jgi:hypothetical protein
MWIFLESNGRVMLDDIKESIPEKLPFIASALKTRQNVRVLTTPRVELLIIAAQLHEILRPDSQASIVTAAGSFRTERQALDVRKIRTNVCTSRIVGDEPREPRSGEVVGVLRNEDVSAFENAAARGHILRVRHVKAIG